MPREQRGQQAAFDPYRYPAIARVIARRAARQAPMRIARRHERSPRRIVRDRRSRDGRDAGYVERGTMATVETRMQVASEPPLQGLMKRIEQMKRPAERAGIQHNRQALIGRSTG
ncbi:hypothetical protein BGC_56450 [Burkholderia sp. 3C]